MDAPINPSPRFLVVDDHALVRDGMLQLLGLQWPQARFLEAATSAQALALVDATPDLDLVLFDLHLPDMDGFDTLAQLTAHAHAIPVIVVSSSDSPRDMQQALAAGALGYLVKSDPKALMLSAIQLVLAGGVYIPTQLARNMAERQLARQNPVAGLSARQLQVLKRLIRGDSNLDIAANLGLSEVTVKKYVGEILKALEARNRTDAARIARELGYDG